MLVKELIGRLQELDQEKEVYILESGDSPFEYGYTVKRVYELKGAESCDGVYIEEE